MITGSIKQAHRFVHSRAPSLCYLPDTLMEWWRLSKRATSTCRMMEDQTLQKKVQMIFEKVNKPFRPLQIDSEILQLLELLGHNPPRRICEIGGAGGGTLVLFSQIAAPDAHIISIDLNYTLIQRQVFHRFARVQQKIKCLQADSHRQKTVARVKQFLAGESLDFLFIDGDHSYSGVSTDFRLYAPFVKAGGLIVFHDIIPDMKTRCGESTRCCTGEVPRFWSELKTKYDSFVNEFVQDSGQDGFGIGVLRWPGN